ncbi:MAG TPA: hypothetical protein VFM68_03265 [Candidatus Saccharimonadales bacterium]|nr:hypothetical protein [Candidatus Saccharimonadales bacterium]
MAYFAANAVKKLLIACLALVFSGVLFVPAPIALAQSNIDVTVCDGITPATLTASLPQSDSVVTQPMVTLSGSVSQSNQLEVYVNNAFNGVEPLSARDTSYSTSVQLTAGTQTVKLIAVDTCQVGNAMASVVLTYQPVAPEPSTGGDVVTEVPGGVVIEPVDTVTSEDAQSIDASSHPIQSVLEQFVVPPLVAVGEALDLTTPDVAQTTNSISSMNRFAMLIGGILLIIFASRLSMVALAVATQFHVSTAVAAPLQQTSRIIITMIGAALIALVFML